MPGKDLLPWIEARGTAYSAATATT
jgi:hypothetical protein